MARIFAERKQTGRTDLEAVEMALRATLHQAGTTALSQLLRFPEPAQEQRSIACPCGQQARYRELRSRRILTALGEVEITRPWYLCPYCAKASSPPTTNWGSTTPTSRRVCGACTLWSASKRPSITAANR